ncbi:MAG: hydroxymethylbilane synthase, partial [Candidatus Tectomicrobia bacterium]|nr:hydroxymethylbilane synthase [Candidatus Tectomicrobia bacterium]
GSQLALWQTEWVINALKIQYPALQIEIVKIRTMGDKITDVPLANVGGKGIFVKEIEEALFDGRIDLAVHSVKDLPTQLPQGLVIGAITEREDPRDVLISRDHSTLSQLKGGAKIGTSSVRRQAQILHFRPDLSVEPIRGNVDTRIRKLNEGNFDAIVVAAAGILRMGWAEKITEFIPESISLPAIGQGALGVEIRESDSATRELVEKLDHLPSSIAVKAERAFLRRLEGGCQVPIAAFATVNEKELILEGMVSDIYGKLMFREKATGSTSDFEGLAIRLAEALLGQGADRILELR